MQRDLGKTDEANGLKRHLAPGRYLVLMRDKK